MLSATKRRRYPSAKVLFHSCRIFILVILFNLTVVSISTAQSNALYAISSAGELLRISINGATQLGGSTLVRPAITGKSNFHGLVYLNGYFYTSYGAGQILKFGFQPGTEVVIGGSGYSVVSSLAQSGDGYFYASVSQRWDGQIDSVGRIDLTTGQITNVHTISTFVPNAIPYHNITSLAPIVGSSELMVADNENDRGGDAGNFFHVVPTTGDTGPYISQNTNQYVYPPFAPNDPPVDGWFTAAIYFDAIATDPSTGNTYGFKNNFTQTYELYQLIESLTSVNLAGAGAGALPGYQIMGATYGPLPVSDPLPPGIMEILLTP